MTPINVTHKFVEFIPSRLDAGVIYVSIPYATAVHLCASGCGNKVVTPIGRDDWHLLFDGETISLTPSIGNGEYPCRSHYWIRNDQVVWADAIVKRHDITPQPVSTETIKHEKPMLGRRVLRVIRRWLGRWAV